MDRITLGKTGITVCRNGFGALPIQRIGKEDAAYLVRKAYENGVEFFDTARAYSDREEKSDSDNRTELHDECDDDVDEAAFLVYHTDEYASKEKYRANQKNEKSSSLSIRIPPLKDDIISKSKKIIL